MGSYYLPPSGSQIDQFEKIGHPGRLIDPIVVNSSSEVDFTGSNYGYGAFSLTNTTNVEITASNGALLEGDDFTEKTVYEIGIKRIKIGSSGKAIAYKLRGM